MYDFSLTKNVVQMFLALIVLFLILTRMAKNTNPARGLLLLLKDYKMLLSR
ncbi:hypothetical protein [Paraflavitalea speifideaquila]|uniref:hypothetical protein n=1 Tax=Paraflavitalea speifideaquila TaxID=3076558 RepID=UPI0028E3DAD7|nr:hypothetical protein [Paraflavitalea speifideiaquila]